MKKPWRTTYEWDLSNLEKGFVKKLEENGFEVIGNRMYMTKTEWKLRKDGIEFEYSILSEATLLANCWKSFLTCWETHVKYKKLMEEHK